jgi:hypothetical protein
MDLKAQCITAIAILDKQIKQGEEDIALHKKQCRHHKYYEGVVTYLNCLIRISKLERLIYATILKGPNQILDLYREKIEEILSDTHQMSSDLVKKGIVSEKLHLEWCSDTLRHQKYIKGVCDCYKN